MKAFLAEADRRGVLPMFYLELCSGLRRGELCALKWKDLDIARRNVVVVCENVVMVYADVMVGCTA